LYPFGIWGSSPNDVLVPAQEFLIEFYKWDGKSWSRMITSNDFSRGTAGGVWGISANEVWAVGWGDNILHWNGSRWARVSSGSPNGLTSVWGSHSSTDVWAVGDRGTILHWYR
jgi:hypothetical protein